MHQNFLFLLRFIKSLKCDNIDIVFMEARETQLLEFNFINLKKNSDRTSAPKIDPLPAFHKITQA